MGKKLREKISGYGMGSPWEWKPENADERAAPAAGAGMYWGTGIRNKMGKMRSSYLTDSPGDNKTHNEPPKTLA
ncbi:MAG: hypothetical protein KGI50_05345 [Patescibacteria group bacterium]|nr:hypothetical protein [Patescibacteria group bacterium]MDE2438769.1 hypothetical protein [Patescibacteria group bacterium]